MNVSQSTYRNHVICLTFDTCSTLNVTLTGFASLIKLLLSHGFCYILQGKLQSDRLEGEFGDSHQVDAIMLCTDNE